MGKIDFGALRAKKGSNVAALQKQLEKNGQGGFKADERIWKPMPNKQNVTEARIRFLPIPKVDMESANEGKILEEDLTPMAKVIKHWFKGPTGKNYIELSPATFGEPCPVRDFDAEKWGKIKNLGDVEKKVKRAEMGLDDRLPRTEMYANILVVKDSTNPENEGKVMLLKFGNAIYNHIEKAGEKKFSTDVIFDPFCPWEGADLIMNLEFEEKEFKGNKCFIPEYKACTWATPEPVGDDEFISKIWDQQHSLAAFMDRASLKTYDELQTKLYDVMCCDDEGNEEGSAKGAAKGADEMLERLQMAEQSSNKDSVDDKAAPAKEEPKVEDEPKSDPKPETGGDGDVLADFEDMLKNI